MNNHFLQSKYWKEIKESLGNKTFEVGNVWFQTTKLPFLNKCIGYIPRAYIEDIDWNLLYKTAKAANCIYVSIDPLDLEASNSDLELKTYNLKLSGGKPTHLKENVVLDITQTDEKLLENMKSKHRYNLRLAQKKGVEVTIGNSEEMFEEFLKLYRDTGKRQNYFARSNEYLIKVWKYLRGIEGENLVQIASAYYNNRLLSSWMLFTYKDTIYYPYGGSSDEYRNVMGTYALLWEIIQWGKKNNYKYIDLWGIEKNQSGEYDGFSRFKLGFVEKGIGHVFYGDTIDLVIDPILYKLIKLASRFR